MGELDSLGGPEEREAFFKDLGKQIENFLLYLERNTEELVRYVNHPFEVLEEIDEPEGDNRGDVAAPRLSYEAKAILLQSNYSVIKEVMSYRGSTAARWVCVWVI
jgi:hypothetical protein